MLPSNLRLSIIEFRRNKNPLIVSKNPIFDLLIKKGDHNESTRFAFMIPKKLDKRPTKRNRTKRIIEEGVRYYSSGIKKGWWVILKAKKIFLKEKSSDVYPFINQILKKSNLS